MADGMANRADVILEKEAVMKALVAAPGPLPWYGNAIGNRIYMKGREFEWTYSQDLHQKPTH
jgi:hypothetical protein